jgi:hypothetical protein
LSVALSPSEKGLAAGRSGAGRSRAPAPRAARRAGAGELEVGERGLSFFFWAKLVSVACGARLRDGGGAIDVYVNFECSAGFARRRGATRRRGGCTVAGFASRELP